MDQRHVTDLCPMLHNMQNLILSVTGKVETENWRRETETYI